MTPDFCEKTPGNLTAFEPKFVEVDGSNDVPFQLGDFEVPAVNYPGFFCVSQPKLIQFGLWHKALLPASSAYGQLPSQNNYGWSTPPPLTYP